MSFVTIRTESEIGEMKSNLRRMERKRDSLAIQVAKTLNFPSIWTTDMIDWNNPLVSDLHDEFKTLDSNINKLKWEISEAEAILDGTLDYHEAKVKAYKFMADNFNNFDDEVDFFKKNNLTQGMISFIEEVYQNPDYLSEVIL